MAWGGEETLRIIVLCDWAKCKMEYRVPLYVSTVFKFRMISDRSWNSLFMEKQTKAIILNCYLI